MPDKMALGALEGSSPQRSPSLIVRLVSAGVLAQSQGRDWLVSIAVLTPHCPSPAEATPAEAASVQFPSSSMAAT